MREFHLKRKSPLIAIFISVIFLTMLFVGCYTDESTDVGEAYGFHIGDSKEQTYLKAREIYQGKTIFILYPIDKEGFGPHKKIDFSEENYQLIITRGKWEFFFDDGFYNSLILTFDNNRLSNIHRYHKRFELP